MHSRDRPAEHRLHRIGNERVFEGNDEFDELHILFQPALNTERQLIHALEHQCAFRLFVEGDDHVAAELPHAAAKGSTHIRGHQVPVKSFARQRSRDRSVRTDKPQIEAELPSHW